MRGTKEQTAARPGVGTTPEEWVDEHGDVLYRFALARVRDPIIAEDLVQEAFLAALQSRQGFSGRSSERTWLVGILKHKIVDHLRATYRNREVPASEDEADDVAAQFDERGHWRNAEGWGPRQWGSDAAQAIENEELWRAFEECLRALPTRTGRAFALREIDDLSTVEICKVLNVTPTNLWVMLHRARTQLRRCLELGWFAPPAGEASAGGR
jgi:RNA polymerase sigma-70 factor (ECF subfamily)